LGVKKGRVRDWEFPHTSTKKGPQGQALLASLSELTLLPPTLVEYIKLLGGNSLGKMIDENLEALDILEFIKPKKLAGYFSVARWWRTLFPTKSSVIRKLSYFPDKEGKTRVIAIFDYWSQCSLRPLHLHINKLLKSLQTDYTFNQGGFKDRLPAEPTGSYHSIDLSAATDRMPIALQKRVIEYLFNDAAKANAWKEILVGYDFTVKGSNKETLTVNYGAGQPMGAYSSWPTMALTHHILVQVSALRAGVLNFRSRTYFKGYALLGDDLRIDHSLVASEYLNLIAQLDMPYSAPKTHVSKHGFEFAKRWWCLNTEVTGFSISGLNSVWKSYPLLINFLDNQESHGWVLPEGGHPGLILAIHKVIHGDKMIYNRSLSMIKLLELFLQVRLLKKQSSMVWSEFPEKLEKALLKFLPGHTSLAWLTEYQPEVIINLIYLRAKRNLVEKDLYSFQSQAYKVNAKLWGYVKSKVRETCADQAQQEFLLETLSVVLNWNHPIVLVLNRQIDLATEFLMNYWDPEQSDAFLFESGLSKYNISKGVLSMRSVVSIVLAESAILKEFINVSKDFTINPNSENTKEILNKLNELSENKH